LLSRVEAMVGGQRSSVSFWRLAIKRSWRATVPKFSRSNVGLEILLIQTGVIIIDTPVECKTLAKAK
jgi:hypothetical protein